MRMTAPLATSKATCAGGERQDRVAREGREIRRVYERASSRDIQLNSDSSMAGQGFEHRQRFHPSVIFYRRRVQSGCAAVERMGVDALLSDRDRGWDGRRLAQRGLGKRNHYRQPDRLLPDAFSLQRRISARLGVCRVRLARFPVPGALAACEKCRAISDKTLSG